MRRYGNDALLGGELMKYEKMGELVGEAGTGLVGKDVDVWRSGGVVGASSEETVDERRRWWGEVMMGIGAACLKPFKLESSLRGLSVALDMIL
jgi:hypothetical protein